MTMYKSIHALIIIFAFWSCGNGNQRTLDEGLSVQLTDKSKDENWNCFAQDRLDICLPDDWKSISQNQFELFYYLSDDDKASFFVVIEYDLDEIGITVEQYCQEVYKQLVDDTNEKFLRYSFRQIDWEDLRVFYGEFYTEIEDTEYLSYSLVASIDGRLLDITLKGKASQKAELFGYFQNILYTLRVKKRPVFYFDKDIDSSESIDFKTWY